VELQAGKDTLRSIVDRINQTVGDPHLVSAAVNSDGSVTLASKGPHRFVLGQDDSDFSVIMGFNNFFESLKGSQDFRVNERLIKNPSQISTGKRMLPGDNSVALSINQLQFAPAMEGQAITFDEFYNGMLAELGVLMNRSKEEAHNQRLLVDQFQKLRDEVSSVNMDEEVADMVQHQRGFEAAAKFVSTVDDMTKTVIQM
jgi:flagellar hook-associated protein 1 FlgK